MTGRHTKKERGPEPPFPNPWCMDWSGLSNHLNAYRTGPSCVKAPLGVNAGQSPRPDSNRELRVTQTRMLNHYTTGAKPQP